MDEVIVFAPFTEFSIRAVETKNIDILNDTRKRIINFINENQVESVLDDDTQDFFDILEDYVEFFFLRLLGKLSSETISVWGFLC